MTKKPRYKFKIHTCPNCGREHKRYPICTLRDAIIYRGACPYCGVEDFARGDTENGHIEIAAHHTDD
jgi:hypothetical protein